MSSIKPSPQTTLVILLGASQWPLSSLQCSPAFRRSANKIRDYFCHPRLFGLSPENWLDLFDQSQNSPNDVDQAIGNFLDQRILQLKQAGTPARDLLFYYIGHGVFASDSEHAYHLAILSTRDDNIGASSIAIASLAHTLKTKARYLRRIVILDCCFSAESFKYMQSAPDQIAIQQTEAAFEEKSKGSGFPKKGTALLCSSGHKIPSLILQDESGTMFSEALVRALALQNTHQQNKTHLSLYDLQYPVIHMLEILAGKSAPRPEIHSPDQSDGDVASIPFFPNLRFRAYAYAAENTHPIPARSTYNSPGLIAALQRLGSSVSGFVAAVIVTMDGEPVAQVAINDSDFFEMCKSFSIILKSALQSLYPSPWGECEHVVVTSADCYMLMRLVNREKSVFQILITTRDADLTDCFDLMARIGISMNEALH